MTRSPLAYPLNRSADMDAGGAADLQTDIMRFMAILSMCLVAIFALVQSIPMQPAEPVKPVEAETPIERPQSKEVEIATTDSAQPPVIATPEKRISPTTNLTRPKWVPQFVPKQSAPESEPVEADVLEAAVLADDTSRTQTTATPSKPIEEAAPPVESEAQGFTLRFESDAALTQLVAANRVGVYAVGDRRALRMTVRDSRISFWDASTPNTYHEMETTTVPIAVINALSRAGTSADEVSWGVTLPGRLKTQLDELMLEHRAGSLIIVSSGDIRWEAS